MIRVVLNEALLRQLQPLIRLMAWLRWFGPACLALALLALGLQTPPPSPAFAPPAPPQPMPASAGSSTSPTPGQLIEQGAEAPPSAHSVSLVDLGNGRLGAAWFAGSQEGAGDVSIRFAHYEQGRWSTPWNILQRTQVQHDTQRLIRKLGNPVLFRDSQGRLHLWFVSVSFGGWAGSALNHTVSSDLGHTWGPVERLLTSPFWNLSTLVRGAPVALSDGGVALPIYHEFLHKHGEWLRLNNKSQVVSKTRIPEAARAIQPTVAVLDSQRAVALLRDGSDAHRIRVSQTSDGGQTWTPAHPGTLPNPDAGIALLRLADGRLLLAYNPQENNRTRLALSLSVDEGQSWQPPRLIEAGNGQDEFSYPALLQDSRGEIHLAYTWKRQGIRHWHFSADQLNRLGQP